MLHQQQKDGRWRDPPLLLLLLVWNIWQQQ
jgi:hypothetical protein